jgi:DNA-directed RNA polymerase specialized sigma subunit|tara:strand:+ start:382 stop:729 length:348 start_codon:yes stop_codon:yes gene_type:complete
MSEKHYIDNKRFEEVIKQYKVDPKGSEDELFSMFDILVSNIITGFSFKVDEDDAKQECFLLILKTLKNFDPERGNAFNYFTTIILNNLKLLYTKNKKYLEKIEAYTDLKKDLLEP